MAPLCVRRVISGERAGSSVFASIEEVGPVINEAGLTYWPIFGSEGLTELPADGDPHYALSFFPPPGGYRVHVVEYPAVGASRPSPTGTWPPSGLPTGFQRKATDPNMHMTDSVDIVIVLSGEVGLEVEDGTEVTLRQGDVVVQNGAMHAWRYKDVPCRVCFVNLGAVRKPS
jgi:hypothetical protein